MDESEKKLIAIQKRACVWCAHWGGGDSCARRQNVSVNLVSGAIDVLKEDCDIHRGRIGFTLLARPGLDVVFGLCGTRGRYWEPNEGAMSLRERAQVARQG